jgi:hypothetical protein
MPARLALSSVQLSTRSVLMKTTKKTPYVSMVCGCLFALTANAQMMIESYEEYPSDADLQAVWSADQGTMLTLSPYVAYRSTGTNSMRVDVNMLANTWQTTVLSPSPLPAPISIAPTQYVTLRVAGDPAFTNASYQQLFIYVWDGSGKFGRWGGAVPTTTTNWQVFNFLANTNTIGLTWDTLGMPDLSNIVQFKIYLYGQGDPAGTPFTATIYVDELQIRDSALIEFPPPSPMRARIDNFEGYADSTALLGFYHYVNGGPTVTTASLETPAPQGTNALKLAIDFGAGQWPWGAAYSANVAPFSFPTNATVSLWFKGDPTLAPVADGGTVFYLSFYDQGGNVLNFTTSAPVTSSGWTKLQASFGQFWSSAVVDTGNLVQWRVLVEGWQGTVDSQPMSGTFAVDDIMITVPPSLAVVQQGTGLQLLMNNLIPGTWYTLELTTNFAHPVTYSFPANSPSDTWPVLPEQKAAFFRLYYTP